MMKKALSILLVALILVQFAAATTLIPISYDIAYENNYDDDTGERITELLLPSGYRHTITWPNGTSEPSDKTFTAKLYYELNENEWCEDNSQLTEYKNISLSLTQMLSTCKQSIDMITENGDLEKELRQTAINYSKYFEMYNTCSEDYEEVEGYKEKYDSCESARTIAVNQRNELQGVEDELETAQKAKNTHLLIGIAIGLGVGWYLWKRQKRSGPSEHVEAGTTNDYDYGSRHPQYDGPKE